MDGLVFQGSNDLSNWTTLTDPTFKTFSWQNLDSSEEESFRYLRVRNGMPTHIAELRLFGSIEHDLDHVLARADAVDLDRALARLGGPVHPRGGGRPRGRRRGRRRRARARGTGCWRPGISSRHRR